MNNFKENSSFKYFILIMIIPVIGISLIFFFTYFYIQDEISFIEKEKKGLYQINQIQDVLFDIQRLRGLSNFHIKDGQCLKDIEKTKKSIIDKISKSDIKMMKTLIVKHNNNIKSHLKNTIEFKHLSLLIQDSIMLIENIAYNSGLILDDNLHSSILIETIISILPELIENNGQIRGITASIEEKLTEKQIHSILIQLSKVKDKITRLKFNMSKLSIVDTFYKDMLKAQNSLISFTYKEVLNTEKIIFSSTELFRLNTNDIEFISLLYSTNSKELKSILNSRIKEKQKLELWIILIAILSIVFIGYINITFFRKNQEFIRQIELLSVTDGMTTLFNRRHFDAIFEKQQKIGQRAKENLIFIMMDIDHFKQYNDTYGHQAGDDTLIAVANSLKNSANRPDDMVFRLGGEEFGVLCSKMDTDESILFADRLRSNIEELKIPHCNSTACEFVTVSVGLIVVKPSSIYKMNEIYNYADKALYTAKQNSRNCINLYKEGKNE